MQQPTLQNLANWILVSEEKDFNTRDMAWLQSAIHEGTRVTLLRKKSERGNFLVSSIHVDDEGSMR